MPNLNPLTEATDIVAQTKSAVDPVGSMDLRKLLTQMPLCDLARCPDVEVSTKHNNIEVQIKQPANIINVDMRQFGKVSSATLYVTERVKPKYRLEQEIMVLRDKGLTQDQVARLLNMSQSYVSFLERKYKQRHNKA